MNCTFLQSSMRPWGGFLLRLWREVSVNSQKEKHRQHESTGSLSRFMFGFDRFSWRSARSRARTPGDSTLTLILCQDVEHHCKQFESVRLRFSFLLPRIAALSEAWWVWLLRNIRQNVQSIRTVRLSSYRFWFNSNHYNFRRAQFWNCPFSAFALFHVIQRLSSARKSCSWGFCEWRGASGHELRIPCPVSFIA